MPGGKTVFLLVLLLLGFATALPFRRVRQNERSVSPPDDSFKFVLRQPVPLQVSPRRISSPADIPSELMSVTTDSRHEVADDLRSNQDLCSTPNVVPLPDHVGQVDRVFSIHPRLEKRHRELASPEHEHDVPDRAAPTYRKTVHTHGQPRPLIHRIVDGDSLTELSQRYLGTSERYLEIYELNRSRLASPHILPIGTEIVIPARRDKTTGQSSVSGRIVNKKSQFLAGDPATTTPRIGGMPARGPPCVV